MGGAMIMGRRTWESLPFKPLGRRLNIVVSSKPCDADAIFGDVQSAIDFAHAQGYRRLYGMGGAGIYGEMMDIADRLLITEVDIEIEGADTFFPQPKDADWQLTGSSPLRKEPPVCVVNEYLRRIFYN